METSKSFPLYSFKSKKLLRNGKEGAKTPTISPGKESKKVSPPASTPWGVQTPGKAANPPRRLRNHSAAMSIKEIRQAALILRESGSAHTSGSDPELGTEKEKEHVARPKKKFADTEKTLPKEYELLVDFFNNLYCSIRLLQSKRSATIFTNIKSQVEILTNRRFKHSHLAQLKFIMPEVIVVEKVLRHDERTGCMKPDLRITLNVEAIEHKGKSKSSSSNLQLGKMFHDRLLDFFKSHPEGDEVPEEALPEPFGQLKKDPNPIQSSAPSSTSETPDVRTVGQTVKASHFPVSFKSRFSQQREKASISVNAFGSECRQFESSSPSGKETRGIAVNSHSGSMPTSLPETPMKCINPMADSNQNLIETVDAVVSTTPVNRFSSCSTAVSPLPETPVKCMDLTEGKDGFSFEANPCLLKTPVDNAGTPIKLMSATPGLRPPKRCYMSPDDDNSSRLSIKLGRRPPNRPLTFGSPVKSVKKDDGKLGRSNISSTDQDMYDILPLDLIQSIQEKERLAEMEKDPAISQAKWRKQMLASLPKLFDMVYFLFQSIRRSVITKEEVIQKIITGHLDIVDRKEIEEQLRLLQEFAPEWICEKAGLSGDNLICVNKISCPDAIRQRLLEAN